MALCVGTVSRIAHGQVVEVWSAGDGEKIRPETETMPKTETKPGGAIELFGMRNETLSFQVVVKAGAVAARDVKLQIEGLDVGEVSVFRVDAVQVAKRSHGLVWKPGSAAEPTVAVGAIPDRLVPLSSNETVTIPARGQQVFWVDLWVSPRAKPGLHTARLTLMSEVACEGRCSLDVSVELLDRTMPDEMRARSMVWFSGTDVDERVLGRYFSDPTSVDSAKAQELRLRHYQLARKHRISLFGQHQAIDTELDDLLSGEAFTEARGYRGPGQGRGLDVLALHAYGGELTQDDASRLVVEAKKYPDLIDSFVYIMDEPGSEQRSEINRRVKASRPMTSFVTTMYTPKLDTDIFALLAGMYSRKNAEAGAAAGKKIWIYNGERPFTGSFAIDDVAISPRVNPWIQYKLGIERWFYWEATYYFDFQGKRGAIEPARRSGQRRWLAYVPWARLALSHQRRRHSRTHTVDSLKELAARHRRCGVLGNGEGGRLWQASGCFARSDGATGCRSGESHRGGELSRRRRCVAHRSPLPL